MSLQTSKLLINISNSIGLTNIHNKFNKKNDPNFYTHAYIVVGYMDVPRTTQPTKMNER